MISINYPEIMRERHYVQRNFIQSSLATVLFQFSKSLATTLFQFSSSSQRMVQMKFSSSSSTMAVQQQQQPRQPTQVFQ